jgi:TolB-like protein/Tfp pilus assembly protein PilF
VDVSLFSELKRRRVFRALVGYGIAAFAVLQIIEPVMHGLHWPEAVLSYVVVGLAVGFPVVVTLAWIFDVNEGRIERTAGKPVGGRLALALVGIGVLAAAPGIIWYFVIRARPAPAESAAGPSIAVLPLVNLSSDKEQEYFSDGLSEELLNLLAKVPGLHVAARTSAFAFKGKNEKIGDIARELNVATVLEGSVRKAGDQIRITTQLINAADGYHLWSETYDRKLTDVFAVQDEIAKAVVGALKLKLLAAPSSMDRRTVHPDAYNEYLLGRQLFNLYTADGFRRAARAYENALQFDPRYARAWAGLAAARYWAAQYAESAKAVDEGQRAALDAAEKAVELGPELADGYLIRGDLRSYLRWDWKEARADLERARKLEPDESEAAFVYATAVARPGGQLQEAIAVLRKASDVDPLNPRVWKELGVTLLMAGEIAPARVALKRSLEISPDGHSAAAHLASSYLLEGKPEQALDFKFGAADPGWRFLIGAMAEHDLGRPEKSHQALDEWLSRWAHVGMYQAAQAYAWRGDKDKAFDWLERAYRQRDGGLMNVKRDPLLRNLHGDPRFAALLQKMHLPLD